MLTVFTCAGLSVGCHVRSSNAGCEDISILCFDVAILPEEFSNKGTTKSCWDAPGEGSHH